MSVKTVDFSFANSFFRFDQKWDFFLARERFCDMDA